MILIDRGVGIKKTLSKVNSAVVSDKDALELAFQRGITGRSPEPRGDGLYTVSQTVIDRKWDLYFQSGNGFCKISNGKMNFGQTENSVVGCVILLKYN